jgi:nucleotide-binding universal stress UspA family protein
MSTSSPPTPPRFVVVAAVDSSSAASGVVSVAAGFARTIPGAELHLVHVIDHSPISKPFLRDAVAAARTREAVALAKEMMERHLREAEQQGATRPTGHITAGEPWREILRAAGGLSADLVLVGTHGRVGVERLVLGSVAEIVVRKASCPVVVVRPKDYRHRDVPEIEPPCPACLETQRATRGERLWCDRHAQHHPHAHTHYEMPQGFGEGSMLLRM